MIKTVNYYIKCNGIQLPDGTVFGAETRDAFRVVSESGVPGFIVYEIIGKEFINVFGSGVRVSWGEMKKVLDERIAYQISIGNKVFRGFDEITEV